MRGVFTDRRAWVCHKIDQQSRWWELDPLPPLTRDAEIEHQCRAAVGLAWVQAALHIFLGPELAVFMRPVILGYLRLPFPRTHQVWECRVKSVNLLPKANYLLL